MRTSTKWTVIVLLLMATGLTACGSSSGDAAKKTSTTTSAATANPDKVACGTAGYVASNGSTDPAVWKKVAASAQSIKASDTVMAPLRALARSYAQKDTAGAATAKAKLLDVCKIYAK